METKIRLWAIPILLIGLIVVIVVIEQSQPAPGALAQFRQILSNGGDWFMPALLMGLWLAMLLGAVRGVGLGIGIGLFSLGVCRLALPVLPEALAFHWINPPVPMTLGGMIGGLVGGMLDRPRGTSSTWEHSWSVRLALVGAGLGFGVGFCVFALFAAPA